MGKDNGGVSPPRELQEQLSALHGLIVVRYDTLAFLTRHHTVSVPCRHYTNTFRSCIQSASVSNGKSSGDYGGADLTRQQIIESVDESLKRLGTDYIDLLQLHWPGRYTGGLFGSGDFKPSEYGKQCKKDNGGVSPPRELQEQLSALQELIDCGKVRYFGVSNETPYGVCSMSSLHEYFPELYPKCIS